MKLLLSVVVAISFLNGYFGIGEVIVEGAKGGNRNELVVQDKSAFRLLLDRLTPGISSWLIPYLLPNMNTSMVSDKLFSQVINILLSRVGNSGSSLIIDRVNDVANWMNDPLGMVALSVNLLPASLSPGCRSDLVAIVTTIIFDNEATWAWKMLDSFGKMPHSITRGNLLWAGNFWQCLDVEVKNSDVIGVLQSGQEETSTRFTGEYCLVKLTKSLNDSDLDREMASRDFMGLLLAMCFPSTCSLDDKQLLFRHHSNELKVKIEERYCQTSQKIPMDFTASILTVILLLPVLLVIVATAYDYCCRLFGINNRRTILIQHQKTKIPTTSRKQTVFQIVSQIFSARNSLQTLFYTTTPGESSGNTISCLFGIRTICMLVIIWVHTFTLRYSEMPWKNILDYMKVLQYPLIHLAAQSFAQISAFFVLSGFCLTYSSVVAAASRNGEYSILRSYFNRYLRIMTSYFYVAAFNAGPLYYLIKGPMWPSVSVIKDQCRRHWLRRLLNSENLFLRWSSERDCITGEWFVGVDWHLYLVAVPLVWLLIKKPRLSIGCIVTAMCVSTVALFTFWFTDPKAKLFYTVMIDNTTENDGGLEVPINRYLYTEFWTRGPSFGIGMLVGYYVACQNNQIHISRLIHLSGTALAWITLIALEVFGYKYFIDERMPSFIQFIYFVFANFMFPSLVCWVIVLCVRSPTGLLNRLFSAKMFQCVGKLTYGMFLGNQTILFMYYNSSDSPNTLSYYDKVIDFGILTVLGVVVAAMLYVVVESPTDRFLKLMRQSSAVEVKKSCS